MKSPVPSPKKTLPLINKSKLPSRSKSASALLSVTAPSEFSVLVIRSNDDHPPRFLNMVTVFDPSPGKTISLLPSLSTSPVSIFAIAGEVSIWIELNVVPLIYLTILISLDHIELIISTFPSLSKSLTAISYGS